VTTLARSYATHDGPSEEAGSKSTKSTKTTKTKKTKKKAGKKPAVRKARKVLTEEQKEARAQRRKAEELKETKRKLKAAALQTPKLLPTLPWVNAMKDKLSEVDKSDNPSPKEAFSRATELARKATPEEKQVCRLGSPMFFIPSLTVYSAMWTKRRPTKPLTKLL
jgi:hypothetical protein